MPLWHSASPDAARRESPTHPANPHFPCPPLPPPSFLRWPLEAAALPPTLENNRQAHSPAAAAFPSGTWPPVFETTVMHWRIDRPVGSQERGSTGHCHR